MRCTAVLRAYVKDLPKSWANMPETYIKKQTQFKEWEPPKLPNYQRKVRRYRKFAYYDIHRPWTYEFQQQHEPGKFVPKIYVEPHKFFPVFKGDYVEVLAGKDKGKQGVVNLVVPERNWVCVDRLNIGYTQIEKTADNPGLIMAETLPLLYGREVQLVDPKDRKPTLIEWRHDENGNDVRVSRRTGRIIPIPADAEETYDYKVKEFYPDQAKDTPAKAVEEVTFVPEVKTFEMDIMEKMGIKEDRVPYLMYWY